eukprot:4697229-Pyramimonas_sp.AAC.1
MPWSAYVGTRRFRLDLVPWRVPQPSCSPALVTSTEFPRAHLAISSAGKLDYCAGCSWGGGGARQGLTGAR